MKLKLFSLTTGRARDGLYWRRNVGGVWEQDDTAAPDKQDRAVRAKPRRERFATPDELVAAHLDLAHAIAGKFIRHVPAGIDTDALRGAALEGLVVASRRYNPSRVAQFSTFAGSRIWGSMQDELRRLDPNSRGARARGEAEPPPLSFEIPVGVEANGDTRTLGGTIPARNDTEREALDALEIRAALAAMSDRQRPIVMRALSGESLRSIGADLGVGESRVSQIVAKARERVVEAIGAHQDG